MRRNGYNFGRVRIVGPRHPVLLGLTSCQSCSPAAAAVTEVRAKAMPITDASTPVYAEFPNI
jgi:hypothetical protein